MKQKPPQDEEDPFLKLVAFLDGKGDGAVQFHIKANDFLDAIKYNVLMIIFLAAALFVLVVVLTPILLSSENPYLRGVSSLLYVTVALSYGCHQLPYRSLIMGGVPQAVCSRDVGIYVGAIIGFATVFIKNPPKILSEKKSLLIAFAPIALDGVSQTILHMRESNNVIRVATGLIFTFFLVGFIANRLFIRRYPGFREKALDPKFLALDLIVIALLAYNMAPVAYTFGMAYMSRGEAVGFAKANSTIQNPAAVESYYVAPLAPVSLHSDPFYKNHNDAIIQDLFDMPYYLPSLPCGGAGGNCSQSNVNPNETSLNKTLGEMLYESAETQHNLGLWVVAVLEERQPATSDPYTPAARGEYYYFDAYTHKIVAKKNR